MAVDALGLAHEDLLAGRWQAAKERFEEACAREESAEAVDGLGEALWWLGDVRRGVELRERAYADFRRRGELLPAARVAIWLSTEYLSVYGNEAASSGWLGRAERIVEGLPTCAEQGWIAFRRAKRKGEPQHSERTAREVIALARQIGDHDLEVASINLLGRALLGQGRMEEGFSMLDESMAAALGGEVQSIYVVSETCCSMIVACERTMELVRAAQWCQVTDDYARRRGVLPILAFCRITYATVLVAQGRWAEAEVELLAAHEAYQQNFPAMSVYAVSRLALLRLLQGRASEAAELLKGYGDNPTAAQAVASLQLASDAPAVAARIAKRRLDVVGDDALLAPPFLVILVEAAVQQADIEAAKHAARRLAKLVDPTRCTGLIGASQLANGIVAALDGDERAQKLLDQALETFQALGMPLEAARARLCIAELLVSEDSAAAASECQIAKAAFEQLGARRLSDQAASLLRKLGAGGRNGPRLAEALSRREQEVLDLMALGLSNAEIGARLFISAKTVEHHVGHVLGKLNLKNRAAAAAYVVRSRPAPAGAKPRA